MRWLLHAWHRISKRDLSLTLVPNKFTEEQRSLYMNTNTLGGTKPIKQTKASFNTLGCGPATYLLNYIPSTQQLRQKEHKPEEATMAYLVRPSQRERDSQRQRQRECIETISVLKKDKGDLSSLWVELEAIQISQGISCSPLIIVNLNIPFLRDESWVSILQDEQASLRHKSSHPKTQDSPW